MPAKSWFAIHTRAGREQEASMQLQQQGFEVYLPMAQQRITHARKVSWQPRPLLPGYLFAHLAEAEQRWTTIRSTRGIIGPVRFGIRCPVINEAIILAFKAREDEDGHIVLGASPKAPFRKGERVRLLDGPMAGLEGVFTCIKGEERAMVFMQLLQRQVQVTVATQQLIAA